MIKANRKRIELDGSYPNLITELIFVIDAIVMAHAEGLPITTQQAKEVVKMQIDNAFEKFIGTDETTEGVEMTSIKLKIPKGDEDGGRS